MSAHLDELIDIADIDELIREIDRICVRRDWDQLLELHHKCRRAVETGRQLWGVAGHAEYRIALETPAELAVTVMGADPGPFVPGPLAEVLARSHGWAAIKPHLEDGPYRQLVAYECVAAGQDLSNEPDARVMQDAFELPLRIAGWEPDYPKVIYRPDGGEFPRPALAPAESQPLGGSGSHAEVEPDVERSLKALTKEWNGAVALAASQGSPGVAVAATDPGVKAVRPICLADAVAVMAWAGASGGFNGRRSGAASGRAKAWWALAALLGEPDCDAGDFDELIEGAGDCKWWTWGDHVEGAVDLRIAMTDESADISYAFCATDANA